MRSGGGGSAGSRFGGIGRLFGEGEPWLRWGVPCGMIFGVRVRVHWIFLIMIVVGVIFTLPHHQSGIGFRLPLLASLFAMVVLHEIGRVIATRAVGGEVIETVLWPIGGMAITDQTRAWDSELKSVFGGSVANALLMPLLGGLLFLATRSWSVAIPNPLDMGRSIFDLSLADGTTPWWLVGLWSVHSANMMLLLFNLLVPMHPLDAGRIVQCLLWRRVGYHRSLWLGAHVGLVTAVVLVGLGVLFEDGKILIAIGAFGAAVSWAERRRIQFLASEDPVLDAAGTETGSSEANESASGPSAQPDQAELDRILEKISKVGMGGLSGQERRVLKRATRRSRETEGGPPESDE